MEIHNWFIGIGIRRLVGAVLTTAHWSMWSRCRRVVRETGCTTGGGVELIVAVGAERNFRPSPVGGFWRAWRNGLPSRRATVRCARLSGISWHRGECAGFDERRRVRGHGWRRMLIVVRRDVHRILLLGKRMTSRWCVVALCRRWLVRAARRCAVHGMWPWWSVSMRRRLD